MNRRTAILSDFPAQPLGVKTEPKTAKALTNIGELIMLKKKKNPVGAVEIA